MWTWLASLKGLRAKELRVKRQAAAARAFRVRVVEEKAAAHQTCVVVEFSALEQGIAFRVDKNPRVVRPAEDLIRRAGLFHTREYIRNSGGRPPLHPCARRP